MTRFIEHLTGLTQVRFEEGKLLTRGLGQWNEAYVPVTGTQFRHLPKKDPPDPVSTFELLTPNAEGRFIQAGFNTAMKQVPAWLAITQILATAFVLLSMISIVIYAPFWLLGGISKRRRRPAERNMRLRPLLAVLSLVVFVGCVILSGDDLIARMGNLTIWSGAVFVASLAFAVVSLASFFTVWSSPKEGVRPGVRRFSWIVSVALLIATAYLAYYGIIGLRPWA
jgi:hypothetical protein